MILSPQHVILCTFAQIEPLKAPCSAVDSPNSMLFNHQSCYPHLLDLVLQYSDGPTRLSLAATCAIWAERYAEFRAKRVNVESCFFELQAPWSVLVMETSSGRTRWRPAGERELRRVVIKDPVVQCVQSRESPCGLVGRCSLVKAVKRPRQLIETWVSPGGFTLQDVADIQLSRYGKNKLPQVKQVKAWAGSNGTEWDREMLAHLNCWRPVRVAI